MSEPSRIEDLDKKVDAKATALAFRRTRLVEERPTEYVMHDGQAPFRVPKAGLSDAMHAKIRAMGTAPQSKAVGGPIVPGIVDDPDLAPPPEPFIKDRGPTVATIDDELAPPPPPKANTPAEQAAMGRAIAEIFQDVKRQATNPTGTAPPGAPGMPFGLQTFAPGMTGGAPPPTGGAVAPPPAAPPAEPTPAPKPAAPVAGSGGVGVPAAPKSDDAARADLAEREGLLADERGSIESYAAKQKAEEVKAQGKALLDLAEQEKALRTRAAAETDAAMAKVNAARGELARVDTSVDPGRFWASRSTGGKISGILSLVLGSLGAGADGVNRAAGMLNQAIDRDLDAQKAEHEQRMRKGQAAVASAESLYGMTRAKLGDELAAHHAAKATALELSLQKLRQIEATVQAPLARANAQAMAQAIEKQKMEEDAKAKQLTFDNNVKRTQLGQQNQQLALEGQKVAATAAGAGGLDQKQRDELLGVETYHRDIQRSGEKLKALVKGYGTGELTGPQEAQMRQLVTDMATAAAKLNDPSSVARASEVEAEAKNIFQPGFMQTSDAALGAIDSYMKNAAAKRDTHLRVRGIRP